MNVRPSSKSAIQHCAPEFNALIAILRSTGLVISVRRSSNGAAAEPAIAAANRRGFGQEIGHPAGIDFALAFDAAGKEFFARAKCTAHRGNGTRRASGFRIPRLQRADDPEASDNRMAHSCQSV